MNSVLRVLHIASEPDLRSDREALLKHRGYDVVSVVGNSQAMDLLVTDHNFAFAVLDPEVNQNDRSRLISWLKVVHPNLGILKIRLASSKRWSGSYPSPTRNVHGARKSPLILSLPE